MDDIVEFAQSADGQRLRAVLAENALDLAVDWILARSRCGDDPRCRHCLLIELKDAGIITKAHVSRRTGIAPEAYYDEEGRCRRSHSEVV